MLYRLIRFIHNFLNWEGDILYSSFWLTRRRPYLLGKCLVCDYSFMYYRFGGMGDMHPHFYCDTCNNQFHAEEYKYKIHTLEKNELEEFLEGISVVLPDCPCGGRFTVNASPKCPSCHTDFMSISPLKHLGDPVIIQIKGSYLVKKDF